MDPLGYTMGQGAVRSVRRQLEYEPEGGVSPALPARIIHVPHGVKRLVKLAKRPAAGGGSAPAAERC